MADPAALASVAGVGPAPALGGTRRIPLPAMGASRRPAAPPGADADAGDAQLVARAQQGDRAAFEQLVVIYADRLNAVIVRFGAPPAEAEEIVQEAFLRAWRSLDRFKSESQFFTWLYRIGINEAKRHMARRGTRLDRQAADDAALAAVADDAPTPPARAERRDLRGALERAVRDLPEEYRAPLVLRDIEGLSTAQAAEVMELGEAAFKSRLHRARLAVRAAIEDYLDVEDEA